MAGVSGFGRLLRTQGPGSSHAIGVSAPFTVWAVDPLLGGNNNKKNPYKNNRDPTCWLGPLIMQGSKKCAFRRHNATRNVRFAGTTRSMCSKRYPEPVATKDLTVVGVARSQCSVFAAKFCRRYTISSFIAPPNGEIFRNFYRTSLRLAPTCV